jgi:predicted DNA-binding protein with PD1-like motif
MSAAMRLITHPGPPAPERLTALPCTAVPLRLRLPAGQTLAQAVPAAFAAAGFRFGYLRLDGARFAPLSFVIPAPSPDADHAAWYSATHAAPARARHAGVHLGQREGQAFLHCHGQWDRLPGLPDGGHMLCDHSILAQDHVATGWGLHGAGLVARHDPETQFTLFQPQLYGATHPHNATLLTLRPNQDITTDLQNHAQHAGISRARIEGIGSLVGTAFTAGRSLDSLATEILILSGRIQNRTLHLDICSIGFDGQSHTGPLVPGQNAICVTAELLLLKEA